MSTVVKGWRRDASVKGIPGIDHQWNEGDEIMIVAVTLVVTVLSISL